MPVSRRSLLRHITACAAGLALPVRLPAASAPAPVAMQARLIARRRAWLTGGDAAAHPALDAARAALVIRATPLLLSRERSAPRRQLWPDISVARFGDRRRDTGGLAIAFQRLYLMALAWCVPGSSLSGDPGLKAALLQDVELACALFARRRTVGNWWQFEIGIPRDGMNILFLLYDEIPAATRETFLAACRWYAPDANTRGRRGTTPETGANRADKALMTFMRGLLSADWAEMNAAALALADEAGQGRHSLFRLVTDGDGYYRDGSFIQHDTLPYAGGYGLVLLTSLAEMLHLMAGTPWTRPEAERTFIAERLRHAYAPFMWQGRMMDSVRGRNVAREFQKDYQAGFDLISATVGLAAALPPALAWEMQQLARRWLAQNPHSLFDDATRKIGDKARVLLLQQRLRAQTEPHAFTRVFNAQARVVHQRPTWAFALNLASTRIARYEYINRENRHGWYQGDGMQFLYLARDSGQFSDNFWPTVDPARLPGITVDASGQHTAPGQTDQGAPLGGSEVAGGVTLCGRQGVAGLALVSASGATTALKSWFLLEDAVLCLGSAISGRSGTPVTTVIDNRWLDDPATAVTVDGRPPHPAAASDGGWAQTLHVAGVGGYVLLTDTPARAAWVAREGSWHDIFSDANAVSLRRWHKNYLTLTLEHGSDPQAVRYGWLLLPGATPAETAARYRHPGVEILAQNAIAHVVAVAAQQATLALFFHRGTAAGIACDGPAALAYRDSGDAVTLCLAAIAGQLALRVTLPLSCAGATIVQCDPGVTVVSHQPLTLQIDSRGGSEQCLTLRRGCRP
ncbi:polysaccharide lyase 8 family protein [Pantoea sp. 1.19]|uniref:polysaccharide lyase 8 family protein n=1 Tax=Pantoea sp. 1.19 TaxID=1925589 RepID=UPI000948F8B8|nr:polysaccharide lyase 8 family protein [Pantoea sp. 1.19]